MNAAMAGGRDRGLGTKMALRRFALDAAGGFRGRGGEEELARSLIGAFGHGGQPPSASDGGPELSHSFAVVADGKKAKRTVAAYWPQRRVVLDVADRDLTLDLAWGELLRACLQMESEPQYVVLTNQRDVRLYDLSMDRSAPRLSIAMSDLPKYSEAFPFFAADWEPGATPRIINVDKVSKEVADLVAKVYRALRAEHAADGEGQGRQDDVIRFTLQSIVAMFAEDIGLLPKEYFTTLLYRAAEDAAGEGNDSGSGTNAGARIAELFEAMSTPLDQRDEGTAAIPFFNGGLFRSGEIHAASLRIDADAKVLRALTKAAEANWTFVDPHIFGSVFQGVMDDAERHAQGAHYTAREDIMSVVGPTIVEPWRERIEAAKTLSDLKTILSDLSTYRVLDPACGSGNFLYVAFRELYRLETEVLVRIYDEFPSATKGKGKVSWASGIKATNFFGIDINPFAVELARATLNIAKKIAFEQRRDDLVAKLGQFEMEVDPSLPLDNLDENILCADALFTEWPQADAIVGNPPFLGGTRLTEELGEVRVSELRDRFPDVHGRADLCTHWFRLAHDRLGEGGRAGLIATSSIRMDASREVSLKYLLQNDGRIVEAAPIKDWPGTAAVTVSVVNWIRGTGPHPPRLWVEGVLLEVPAVTDRLAVGADAGSARALSRTGIFTSQGVRFDADAFFVSSKSHRSLFEDPLSRRFIRPCVNGADVLADLCNDARWAVYVTQPVSTLPPDAEVVQYLHDVVRAEVLAKSARKSYRSWSKSWWMPWRHRDRFFQQTDSLRRYCACARVQSRPIFFVLSSRFVPTDMVQLFGLSDDYSFGIIQSVLHWKWIRARGGRLADRLRYTSKVWKTFPWPQEPTIAEVAAVGQAAQALRATRRELMELNGWSLRDLYRSAEVEGQHPLKDAQAALDAAVEAAYGKPADQEATEFLLEMNLALAEVEAEGETIQGPGLPLVDGEALDPHDPRWFSTDCIEPPPLPGSGATEND